MLEIIIFKLLSLTKDPPPLFLFAGKEGKKEERRNERRDKNLKKFKFIVMQGKRVDK